MSDCHIHKGRPDPDNCLLCRVAELESENQRLAETVRLLGENCDLLGKEIAELKANRDFDYDY